MANDDCIALVVQWYNGNSIYLQISSSKVTKLLICEKITQNWLVCSSFGLTYEPINEAIILWAHR